jgi:hypothetical protein
MLMSRHQNAGQNHTIDIDNRSFENVTKLKYLGTALTDQNLIHEEPERLNLGNISYHSVQNLLSSRLLPTDIEIEICKTIILPVVLCGCETYSLTLREKHTEDV